jgi:hypothetical protein
VVLALAIGMLLGVGAFAVQAGADFRAPVPSLSPAAMRSDHEVEQAARAGVLRAEVEACRVQRVGTVTVLGAGDAPVGLTNQHVISDATSVVLSGQGDAQPVEVAGAVDHRDAALVELPGTAGAGSLGVGLRPQVGDRVLVAGFPGGRYEAVWGTVRRYEQRVGRGSLTSVMLIDVQAHPGLSGGAVLDRAGSVAGLVAARDPATGWTVAYPLSEVLHRPTEPTTAGC